MGFGIVNPLLLLVRTRSVYHASHALARHACVGSSQGGHQRYQISYQIKFNEPVLKPGTPEKQNIANHYCLHVPLPLWSP